MPRLIFADIPNSILIEVQALPASIGIGLEVFPGEKNSLFLGCISGKEKSLITLSAEHYQDLPVEKNAGSL